MAPKKKEEVVIEPVEEKTIEPPKIESKVLRLGSFLFTVCLLYFSIYV